MKAGYILRENRGIGGGFGPLDSQKSEHLHLLSFTWHGVIHTFRFDDCHASHVLQIFGKAGKATKNKGDVVYLKTSCFTDFINSIKNILFLSLFGRIP